MKNQLLMRTVKMESPGDDLYRCSSSETLRWFLSVRSAVSLLILALGFSSIGMVALIHRPLPDESFAKSDKSCIAGTWAAFAVSSLFFGGACYDWRRRAAGAGETGPRRQDTVPLRGVNPGC
jgi:hypothetical protein